MLVLIQCDSGTPGVCDDPRSGMKSPSCLGPLNLFPVLLAANLIADTISQKFCNCFFLLWW